MGARAVLFVIACVVLGCREDAGRGDGGPDGAAPNRSHEGLPPESRAIADILAGNGHIVATSGAASGWPSPVYDQETGLSIHDQGCFEFAGDDVYNAAVRRWVAAAGPPKGSMKLRMLDRAVVDAALAAGRDLAPGASATAPDGRVISFDDRKLSVSGGPFVAGFSSHVFTRDLTPRLRFAWAPDGSVLLAVDYPTSMYAKDAAYVQIDPECGCILQVLDAKPWGDPPAPKVNLPAPAGTVRLREPVFAGVDDVETAKSRLASLETILARCLTRQREVDAGPSRHDARVRMSLAIAPGRELPAVSFGPSKVPESTLSCFRRFTESRLFPLQKSRAATIAFDVEVHRE